MSSASVPLLDVRKLGAQYGPTPVLHGIDFAVAEGGITAILGANGAGKTTLLRAVCNMIRTSGEVRLAGTRIDARELRDKLGGDDALAAQILGRTPTAGESRACLDSGAGLALLLASPAFQRC